MFFTDKRSIPQLLFILFSLCLLWLTACGELEFGVANKDGSNPPEVTVITTAVAQIPDGMVLVTVTPIAQATILETTIVTPTAVPTQTATPSPTAEATATATSTPPIPTHVPVAWPSATSTAPAFPEMITYPTVSAIVWPGENVTVNYKARADLVMLCLSPVFTEAWNCQPVPASGPYTLNTPAATTTNLQVRLRASTNEYEVEGIAIIMLYCPENAWFFSGPPTTCPGAPPVETTAAYQRFERGVMLWLENGQWWDSGSVIYVLYDEPNQNYEAFPESSLPPVDAPVPNVEYDPPGGLFVPVSGFGLLWRENSWVRQRLGWALAPEVAYTATVQREYSQDSATVYLFDVDNQLLVLNLFNNIWSERSQP